MLEPFKSFDEIPLTTKEYILSLSEVDAIEELSLTDINSFLIDQEAYCASIVDGWNI
jgi:hypothetical protein